MTILINIMRMMMTLRILIMVMMTMKLIPPQATMQQGRELTYYSKQSLP